MKLRSIIENGLLRFFLICSVISLSGCWDRNEVNDLALITAAGFDMVSDEKIELSVLVFIPKGGGSSDQAMESGNGGASQTLVRSAEGKTVADAMAKLQEKLPRKIFWGHTDVFILDEELAKKGIAGHVDFIMRHPTLRERGQIFVSSQKAKKVLKLMPPLERDLSEVLKELSQHKLGLNITTKKLAQMLIGDSGDCALPWITILPPENKEKPKQTIAYITGTAIFKKDKMIGIIDDSVTRGVLWLRNEILLGVITIKPPKTDGYISVNVLQAQSKLVPKIQNGKWIITLKSVSASDIVQNTTKLDVSNPVVLKSLEPLLAKEIEKRIKKARNQVQEEMKADIFGFAEAFHRKYPDVWNKKKNRWNEIYPNVELKFDTKCHIRRQGLTS
ncbi:Ger(x)C family spore germination protein [Neobacillus rhizophilus]|uniref:Ger(X)C family spore germination protein n=1 Tax=Neobacillus rhizophilus TaxID=2833579 RepID=A0A942U191_9BACI|nr:Ger(x)C family spore germination protein [Neobacillus rhizophilus]MBS4210907.1 Ger(x)C family spore germination protein [Neobacillus rhizophilus]